MHVATVVAIIAISMSGCATANKKTMDSKSAVDIKNQSVTYTIRKKPDFMAVTAGTAVLGVLGGVIDVVEGNGIIARNGVSDPAEAIAIGLATALEISHGTALISPPVSVGTNDAIEIAAAINGAAQYVVDVKTTSWGFVHLMTNWSRYQVIYAAKARLIDTRTKAVVAEGDCDINPESSAGAPTYDELLANQAARLKSDLEAVARQCVQELRNGMLAL